MEIYILGGRIDYFRAKSILKYIKCHDFKYNYGNSWCYKKYDDWDTYIEIYLR